jgi:hypothetical protein
MQFALTLYCIHRCQTHAQKNMNTIMLFPAMMKKRANGLELSGPAKVPSSEIAELAGSAPASG